MVYKFDLDDFDKKLIEKLTPKPAGIPLRERLRGTRLRLRPAPVVRRARELERERPEIQPIREARQPIRFKPFETKPVPQPRIEGERRGGIPTCAPDEVLTYSAAKGYQCIRRKGLSPDII